MRKGITHLIVLAACALATSCASAGPSTAPKSLPTQPIGEASPTALPTFGHTTATFTNIHDGSAVSFMQRVDGTVTGLPPNMDAWLIVKPSGANAFWPQKPGPLNISGNNFVTDAQLGKDASSNKGEKFTLQIAETTKAASSNFMDVISDPQKSSLGIQQLPPSSVLKPLSEVTVTRK